MKKSIIAIVTNSAGAYTKVWDTFSFSGFDKQIYGGLGECVLTLPYRFDYSGSDLVLGNTVELRISDEDTVTTGARTIYRGYISLIEREIDGSIEQTRVHLLGDYTLLSLDFLKNSSHTTLYTTATGLSQTSADNASGDVGVIARDVIRLYRSATGSGARIGYSLGSIPENGNNAKYIFQQSTYRDALDKLVSMATVGTYWYIGEDGVVKFMTPSTTPVHKFIQGRHFSKIHIEQSLETSRNVLLVWNGKTGGSSVYKHYEDAASQLRYGRRADAANEYGIVDTGSADNLGARYLGRRKNPDLKVTCTILDNNENEYGYDIESIQPGDTCTFYGFSDDAGILFQDNMIITQVQYSLESVQIIVEFVNSALISVQNQQSTEIADLSTGGINIPESYS